MKVKQNKARLCFSLQTEVKFFLVYATNTKQRPNFRHLSELKRIFKLRK